MVNVTFILGNFKAQKGAEMPAGLVPQIGDYVPIPAFVEHMEQPNAPLVVFRRMIMPDQRQVQVYVKEKM